MLGGLVGLGRSGSRRRFLADFLSDSDDFVRCSSLRGSRLGFLQLPVCSGAFWRARLCPLWSQPFGGSSCGLLLCSSSQASLLPRALLLLTVFTGDFAALFSRWFFSPDRSLFDCFVLLARGLISDGSISLPTLLLFADFPPGAQPCLFLFVRRRSKLGVFLRLLTRFFASSEPLFQQLPLSVLFSVQASAFFDSRGGAAVFVDFDLLPFASDERH